MKKQAVRQSLRKGILFLSFLLFPIVMNFLSPYVSVNGSFAGIVSGSILLFLAQFISSLFLGRIFCGWICPGGGLQEACFMVNNKRIKSIKPDFVKYIIWIPWFTLIVVMFIRSLDTLTINPLYFTENGISVYAPGRYIIYYVVIGLIVVLSFAAGRRAMCHSICWMAPFMIIGRKIGTLLRFPALRLKPDTGKCNQCGICVQNCPMSLDVTAMVQKSRMENPECILCGICVDSCPRKVLRYSFSLPKKSN